MKRKVYIYVCMALAFILYACQLTQTDTKQLQEKQRRAEQQTAVLCEALQHSVSLDTIRVIAEKEKDIFFIEF